MVLSNGSRGLSQVISIFTLSMVLEGLVRLMESMCSKRLIRGFEIGEELEP